MDKNRFEDVTSLLEKAGRRPVRRIRRPLLETRVNGDLYPGPDEPFKGKRSLSFDAAFQSYQERRR